jgi:YcxB-like protein
VGTPIEGRVTLTEEDVRRGLRETPENRQANLALPVMMGVMLLIAWTTRMGRPNASALSVVPFVIVSIIIGWSSLTAQRKQARKLFAQMLESEREHSYVFDDAGIQIQNQTSTTRLTYLALHRFLEGPTTFLLFVGAPLPQLVPKRAFAEADLSAIRELCAKHVTVRKNPDFEKPSAKRVLILLAWVLLSMALLFGLAFLGGRYLP